MEINLYAVSGKFCIAMAQNFGSDAYFKSFLRVLDDACISYQAEGPSELILPSVRTTERSC